MAKPATQAKARERLSHGQFATVFKVSVRAVKYMTREEGAPHDRDGWIWPDAAQWFVRRETAKLKAAARPTDVADAERRRAIAEATLMELKLERELDDLMTVEESQDALMAAYERVDAKLKGMLPRLAPVAVGIKSKAEAMSRLAPLIEEVRKELYAGDDVPQ